MHFETTDLVKENIMSWTQPNFNTYMQQVRSANPSYENFKRSSLHTFTGMLKIKRFQATPTYLTQIQSTWNALPTASKSKYDTAWKYVASVLFPVQPPKAATVQATPSIRPPMQGAFALPGLTLGGHPGVQAAVTRDARVASRDRVVNQEVRQTMNGQANVWDVRFRLRLVAAGKHGQMATVIVTIAAFSGNGLEQGNALRGGQIGAIPVTHAGAALDDRVKRNWKARIVERWSGAVFVVQDASGDDLETYQINFDFNWVTDPAAASQVVYAVQTTDMTQPADGTINTVYWGVDDGGNTGAAIAHEFGHLIGNPDEYGACTFYGENNVRDATSIMDNETTGQSKAGHYWMVAREIADQLKIPHGNCIVRLNTDIYRVAAGHPWR